MSARPWWIRRWPWIAAAAARAAVAAVPLALRARGRAHLAEVRARLAAAGMGGGLEELRRDAPLVDRYLQSQWRRIVDRAAGHLQGSPLRGKIADWMNGGGPEPDGARAAYEAGAELRAEAAALLAEGIPVAGGLGSWLAAGGGPVDPRVGVRTENVLGIRGLANLLLVQAAFEDDPGPALEALDRMEAVFARPGTLMDGMIGLCASDARDETYCRLAAAGRLPQGAGDRWLAEEPTEPRRVVLALRGERVLFFQPMIEALESGAISASFLNGNSGPAANPLQWFQGREYASGWWLHGSEASARVLGYYGDAEAALREGRPLPAAPDFEDSAGRLAGSMCPNMVGLASSAFMTRQRHRLARAFVHILRGNGDDLRARMGAAAPLLDGGPMDFPLVAEFVEPGRLRLRVDVKAPLPPSLRGLYISDISLPAGGKRTVFLWRYCLIEADIDGARPPVGGK